MTGPDLQPDRSPGFIGSVVEVFLGSRLSLILVVLALGLGLAAIMVTAREEEPQIVVPLADIFVEAPGSSAAEVEKLVATPLEKLLWQIDGVEYVYSVSKPNQAVVTVRFFVGQDRERSLVKLHNKINAHAAEAPGIVLGWSIRPVEIDDVPIVTIALFSETHDDHELRRVGEEVLARLSEVQDISRTTIIGGRPREIRVELQPLKMAGYNVAPSEVIRSLQSADVSITAGTLSQTNRELTVTSDSFLGSAREVGSLVVGVHQGRPVYLRDLAEIIDGPEEQTGYTRIGFSHRFAIQCSGSETCRPRSAVILALAKKKGTNAPRVAREIQARLENLQATVIPDGIRARITRDYGQTAERKVDDLISSLGFAIVTVVALLAMTLGWREAVIVALAVPVSFSLALFVNYLFGYTINRVTLFALILSLGLVVDDPITNVDNIQRHIRMGRKEPRGATLEAVSEVLPPVIMSTLAIIISFTPMFFITGMMGPYMAPMAANVPLTVIFSTVCALTIVPWLAYKLLKGFSGSKEVLEGKKDTTSPLIRRFYKGMVTPFLNSRVLRWALAGATVVALVLSLSLAGMRLVPLKMLPFDNKNEFQIVLDMPEGTTLERTDRVVRRFEEFLATVPEVVDFTSHVGLPSPMDFNGLVRHYYLRRSPNLADIRINLADKTERLHQSHQIVLRLRKELEGIAADSGANLAIVESPPGPPVISTLTAEVYGPPEAGYDDLVKVAGQVKAAMAREPFVVDVDDTSEERRDKLDFVLDKEKAALHGVTTEQVVSALRLALSGLTPATVHLEGERQPLMIRLTVPRPNRSSRSALAQIPVKTGSGKTVPLSELGRFRRVRVDQSIYHKNLRPVVYVFGEMAGRAPGEAILDIQARLGESPLPSGYSVDWAGEGEWKITLDVFRDLGVAFGVALFGIYILLIIETSSFLMPGLIMLAIPLTVLGIMPGFWLLNTVTGEEVGGFSNPVFFTATSMIGMIALGGIVIRNSLVLIDFIHRAREAGMAFKDAILECGAVRFRPIVLTALTTALGAWPITLDPVFSGLAWALIFGLASSTLFTLLIVPVVLWAVYGKKWQ